MATKTGSSSALSGDVDAQRLFDVSDLVSALRNGLLVALSLVLLAIIFESVLKPIIASVRVDQTVMTTLARTLVFLLPFLAYIASSSTLRHLSKLARPRAVITAIIAALVIFGVVSIGQFAFKRGPFAPRISLQLTLASSAEGAVVETG